MIVVFDKNYSQLENESVLKYKKSMDPKGCLSSEIHFLVPDCQETITLFSSNQRFCSGDGTNLEGLDLVIIVMMS